MHTLFPQSFKVNSSSFILPLLVHLLMCHPHLPSHPPPCSLPLQTSLMFFLSLQLPSLLNSCLQSRFYWFRLTLCSQAVCLQAYVSICFLLLWTVTQKDIEWGRRNGTRAREVYYIAQMRGDPVTVGEGANCIHPLLGICPVLPLMALAYELSFDGVWNTDHVPSSLLSPGRGDSSTQVRPPTLRYDWKHWTTRCRTHHWFALALTPLSEYRNLHETCWRHSTKHKKCNGNWSLHSDT